jgi:hypothetical protein
MFGLTTRWSLAGTGSEVAPLATTPSKVTDIVGHGPDIIEVFEVIAVAEGGEGKAGITELGTAFRASA